MKRAHRYANSSATRTFFHLHLNLSHHRTTTLCLFSPHATTTISSNVNKIKTIHICSIHTMESDKTTFAALFLTTLKRPSWALLFLLFTLLTFLSLHLPARPVWLLAGPHPGPYPTSCAAFFRDVPPRKVVMSIQDFGGVGDGTTSNTESFRRAVQYMQRFQNRGGGQLNIPAGTWLTGSFNLTSNFTLFLEHGAVILASQVSIIFISFFFVLVFRLDCGSRVVYALNCFVSIKVDHNRLGWGGICGGFRSWFFICLFLFSVLWKKIRINNFLLKVTFFILFFIGNCCFSSEKRWKIAFWLLWRQMVQLATTWYRPNHAWLMTFLFWFSW